MVRLSLGIMLLVGPSALAFAQDQKKAMTIRSRAGCGWRFALLALVLAGASACAVVGSRESSEGPLLAPYVVTSREIVDEMLRLAEVGTGDVLYDLGSGDGRIVITAARVYGARGIGFELDPELVRRSTENARLAGVSHLVEFRQQDVMTANFSAASVVTIYLSREANLGLRPLLRAQLRPGSRIVSHEFDMGDWQPEALRRLQEDQGRMTTLYLWRIPHPRP
jgi:precorrin-6B methylase 2